MEIRFDHVCSLAVSRPCFLFEMLIKKLIKINKPYYLMLTTYLLIKKKVVPFQN